MLEQQHLWVSGEGGYFRYRIPALALSPHGAVLAFCEARRYTGDDADEIDLLLRRSLDGGGSFGPAQVVASQAGWVCGNPVPLADRATGDTWLVFTKNRAGNSEHQIIQGEGQRSVWMTRSPDDGATWEEPVEITRDVKPDGWGWYATGPGHGIQLAGGRLLVPCNHSRIPTGRGQPAAYYSHVILSDDHGRTWRLGGTAPAGTNECMAVETAPGRVALNCRNAPGVPPQPDGQHYRLIAWSEDGGEHFAAAGFDFALPEPVCQASICGLPGGVLFANPAGARRENLTVRLSRDGCQTWPAARTLHAGFSAYSDLCVTDDASVLCLYERGETAPYETLTLARFNLAWVEKDQARP